MRLTHTSTANRASCHTYFQLFLPPNFTSTAASAVSKILGKASTSISASTCNVVITAIITTTSTSSDLIASFTRMERITPAFPISPWKMQFVTGFFSGIMLRRSIHVHIDNCLCCCHQLARDISGLQRERSSYLVSSVSADHSWTHMLIYDSLATQSLQSSIWNRLSTQVSQDSVRLSIRCSNFSKRVSSLSKWSSSSSTCQLSVNENLRLVEVCIHREVLAYS
jgi:hypothetical protein